MKFPKFVQKELYKINETTKRLKKLNNGDLDKRLQETNPELAKALQEGIENTRKKLIPTVNLNIPSNNLLN